METQILKKDKKLPASERAIASHIPFDQFLFDLVDAIDF